MGIKSIIYASFMSLLVTSLNTSAAVITTDWQSAGDNLITQDTESGLEWLDLTETANMSYNFINGELGAGNMFSGFRYATNSEVVTLFVNFGIDLSEGFASSASGRDANRTKRKRPRGQRSAS